MCFSWLGHSNLVPDLRALGWCICVSYCCINKRRKELSVLFNALASISFLWAP